MTNEEILPLDEVKNGPSKEMEDRAQSGSDFRRQPGIASGRRRGIYVSHISDLGSGTTVGATSLECQDFTCLGPTAALPSAPYVKRWNCRFAECRKVDSFQRGYAHSEGGGGKLSFLHNRAEPGNRVGARLSARSFSKAIQIIASCPGCG